MTKIADHVLPRGTPTELIDFLDNVRAILNNGRYQLRTIKETPDWKTDEGEFLIQRDKVNSIKRLWFFDAENEEWNKIEFEEDETELAIVTTITGEVRMWAGGDVVANVPEGWLICNGATVSRVTYAALFAIVGETYGAGDSSTTFEIPDLRGRMPIGQDDMGGTSANRVTAAAADSEGGVGGTETHTLSVSEMPAHVHSQPVAGGGNGTSGSGNFFDTGSNTGSTGGDAAHNNMPPYIAMNYIIKI